MVLIIDDSSEHIAHNSERRTRKKIDADFDVNMCLKQIKLPETVHTYVTCTRLPSEISTMDAPAIY